MIILPSVNSGIINSSVPQDVDARNYISSVQTADSSTLEFDVKKAINDFVVGCKNDGIWAAIKTACLLAGPKTLDGALIPLVGSAPSKVNFISSDYNRKTGLKGDGSSKYLDSNRANNADPQNSKHAAVYFTETPTRNAARISIGSDSATGNVFIGSSASSVLFRINSDTLVAGILDGALPLNGLLGGSRDSSSNIKGRYNQTAVNIASNSTLPSSQNIYVFSRPALIQYSDARIAFYSIGENIDLEKLDNRVKNYINTLNSLNI